MRTTTTGTQRLTRIACLSVAILFPIHIYAAQLAPNIQALPATDIVVAPNSSTGGVDLRFSTITWNSGDGPIELVAGETGGDRQNIYQNIYQTDGSIIQTLAGTFVWHPLHGHFHFEDYAIYTLQPVDAPGGSARIGSKTTFCIMDTTLIDRRLPNAPKKKVYDQCGQVKQGMSVGWGDKYGAHLAGQEIDITGLPDGDYSLTIEADPKNRLVETNDADNTSCVLVRLSVSTQSVEILNDSGCDPAPPPGGGGEVVINSIDPDILQRGHLTPVTITGSGFAQGMDPVFENGSGPAPIVTDVQVSSDGQTIQAIVTAKSGGPPRAVTWDLRIGDAILPASFTVVP